MSEQRDSEMPEEIRALWAERQGRAEYVAYNGRGAQVRIGSQDTDGVFSPGELLKIALAACTVLSADHVLRSRLGDDFPATVGVSSTGVPDENRYGHLDVELVLDLAELAEEKRAKLAERVDRTSGRWCTVGRTIKAGATYEVTVTDERLRPEQ